MYYGFPPHQNHPDDLVLLKCPRCGWVSKELDREQVSDLGMPWSCQGTCGKAGVAFVRFHPTERARAYDALGLILPTQSSEAKGKPEV